MDDPLKRAKEKAAATYDAAADQYASQHRHVPRIADFTPMSGLAPGLHEIVWKISP